MTDSEKKEIRKSACSTAKEMFEGNQIVKDWTTNSIIDIETGKYIGFEVVVIISPKYTYDGNSITEIAKKLHSSEWTVAVKKCCLVLTFKVYYDRQQA